MGGMSFKCPYCDKWFLVKGPLHSHLVDKHKEPVGFRLEGVAELTRIDRDDPLNPAQSQRRTSL